MELYNRLKLHNQNERVSFHMPGHKGGKAYRDTPYPHDFLAFDTTELAGTDCLQQPTEMLLDAENRAAAYYGAKKSYYLVNGSTCGILAMFYACFTEGDVLLVDRNCHKSVVNAMILTGVCPIYICPEYDNNLHITRGIDKDKIENLLKSHPEIKGVFLTSPNYYGFCSDLETIAQITHNHGAILLVDEAHGAHFAFSNRFPETAIRQGADICVMSLHKTLPAPNQTALLHIGTDRIDTKKVTQAVNLFQTTSPSYVLMLYSDLALEYAKNHGKERTEAVLKMTETIKTVPTDDPFKLILDFTHKGISGYEAEQILREQFGIYAELADFHHVLLMVSWANDEQDFERLRIAIGYIESLTDKPIAHAEFDIFLEETPLYTPKETANKPGELVILRDSIDKISKHTIVAFPPCIPILLPGERIRKAHVDYIQRLQNNGLTVSGLEDEKIEVIKE